MRLVTVLDCTDPKALAHFWAPALGYRAEPFHPPYLRLCDPERRWPDLLLQQVPEPKRGKNRMHLDIQVLDLESELTRVQALGAALLAGPHDDDGYLTAVLADPEGNEFCVIVPPVGSHGREQLAGAA